MNKIRLNFIQRDNKFFNGKIIVNRKEFNMKFLHMFKTGNICKSERDKRINVYNAFALQFKKICNQNLHFHDL